MDSSVCCSKNIQLVFEQYQKARCTFVQSVAELANRQSYIKCLECASVLELLLPLLSDKFPTVRQCAAVATARLAEHNADIAQRVLDCGMINTAMENLNRYNENVTSTQLRLENEFSIQIKR